MIKKKYNTYANIYSLIFFFDISKNNDKFQKENFY